MISKEMYDLLKSIPRHPKTIQAGELYENNPQANRVKELLYEANGVDYEYVNCSTLRVLDGKISLSEKGQALLEEYEQAERNNKIVRRSLAVAKVAMWAAIASAIAAFLSLIPQIPNLISFFQGLHLPVQ